MTPRYRNPWLDQGAFGEQPEPSQRRHVEIRRDPDTQPYPSDQNPPQQRPVPFPPPEPEEAWATDTPTPAPEPTPSNARPATEPPPTPAAPDEERIALARALDELEASKRRAQREAERERGEITGRLIEKLLPVLDNLDRSVAASASSPDPKLRQGIELIRAQFFGVLKGMGIEEIEAVGHHFDPAVHEAVALEPTTDPGQDGIVVDEWQRGYRLQDKVLRPAKVRVGKLSA